MKPEVLFKLSYGLYIVSSKYGDIQNGCIINTATQVTASPERISITISKNNYTTEIIEKSGIFAISILDESADMDLIGEFGFKTGREVNKFLKVSTDTTKNGIPYVKDMINGVIECEVIDKVDIGTHIIFIANITDKKFIKDSNSLTYNYYQTVIKGGTPKNAPSYKADIQI